ncbi:hypothetical protein FOA52_015686 [Chlamydomonas sp. UWO 241]|nr:hypothetical protein FOA52_015686 [Chlamydomonas sp. UWO 241]
MLAMFEAEEYGLIWPTPEMRAAALHFDPLLSTLEIHNCQKRWAGGSNNTGYTLQMSSGKGADDCQKLLPLELDSDGDFKITLHPARICKEAEKFDPIDITIDGTQLSSRGDVTHLLHAIASASEANTLPHRTGLKQLDPKPQMNETIGKKHLFVSNLQTGEPVEMSTVTDAYAMILVATKEGIPLGFCGTLNGHQILRMYPGSSHTRTALLAMSGLKRKLTDKPDNPAHALYIAVTDASGTHVTGGSIRVTDTVKYARGGTMGLARPAVHVQLLSKIRRNKVADTVMAAKKTASNAKGELTVEQVLEVWLYSDIMTTTDKMTEPAPTRQHASTTPSSSATAH